MDANLGGMLPSLVARAALLCSLNWGHVAETAQGVRPGWQWRKSCKVIVFPPPLYMVQVHDFFDDDDDFLL